MAMAPLPFELDKLPDPAREAIFSALTRFEAARACCVSVGWNAALGHNRLWSALDFTDAAAFGAGKRAVRKQDRRKVTTAVIVGACAKAGAALRELTLPQKPKVLSLLPALAAAHPLLRRVALVPKLEGGCASLSMWLQD
jgi:hypothetical protein